MQFTSNLVEIWKPVKDYEGLYEVSNLGRVRTLDKEVNDRWGTRILKGKILNYQPNPLGYISITLNKNKKGKLGLVHRLVAESFIPNPDNKEQVNHINGIKHDNRLVNLEWCTRIENMQHALKNGLLNIHKGAKHHSSKRVAKFDLEMNFIKEYYNIRYAAECNGVTPTQIVRCARGQQKQTGGFIWKYA